ncbi:MAG TPA: DUF4292 domain-containing protein, partial [Hanamia sp.]|nr:DUF4292 domain-containing protein [Hanamia sp.]
RSSSYKSAAKEVLSVLSNDQIDFKTFSAKAKVQYEDQNGKQPDFNAFIRLQKDSVLWVSVNSTFLGIEAFRLYVTPDSIILLNKLDKTVEYHPFSFIESFARIPMNFTLLQNILIGNPVYEGDSIVSFRQTGSHIIIGTIGSFFKNLTTLSADTNRLEQIKLDDLDVFRNRTATLLYGSYEKNSGLNFATERQINVSEKSKVDVSIEFKQYEFNKELSFPFNIPHNYKTK